jgi:hypothetical protein
MWAPILIALMPQLPALIAAFIHKEYPQLTDAQVKAIVTEITGASDQTFDSAIATMAGGQPPQP